MTKEEKCNNIDTLSQRFSHFTVSSRVEVGNPLPDFPGSPEWPKPPVNVLILELIKNYLASLFISQCSGFLIRADDSGAHYLTDNYEVHYLTKAEVNIEFNADLYQVVYLLRIR